MNGLSWLIVAIALAACGLVLLVAALSSPSPDRVTGDLHRATDHERGVTCYWVEGAGVDCIEVAP